MIVQACKVHRSLSLEILCGELSACFDQGCDQEQISSHGGQVQRHHAKAIHQIDISTILNQSFHLFSFLFQYRDVKRRDITLRITVQFCILDEVFVHIFDHIMRRVVTPAALEHFSKLGDVNDPFHNAFLKEGDRVTMICWTT